MCCDNTLDSEGPWVRDDTHVQPELKCVFTHACNLSLLVLHLTFSSNFLLQTVPTIRLVAVNMALCLYIQTHGVYKDSLAMLIC